MCYEEDIAVFDVDEIGEDLAEGGYVDVETVWFQRDTFCRGVDGGVIDADYGICGPA